MVKRCDREQEWRSERERIIGLGERSFRKTYYPQMKQSSERLERFRTLLDHTSDFVMLITLPDAMISDVNEATSKLFNITCKHLIGRPFHSLGLANSAHILEQLTQQSQSFLEDNNDDFQHDTTISEYLRDDVEMWLELSFRVARLDGRFYGVMVGRDVTERIHNEQILNSLIYEQKALLDNALVGLIWIKDRRIVSCSRRFEDMFGYAQGAAIGLSTQVLYLDQETYEGFGATAYEALAEVGKFCGSVQMQKSNGEPIWCELTGNMINPKQPDEGSIWIFSDISEHILTQEKAVFLSLHDSLTLLPNHRLIADRLQQAIAVAGVKKHQVAIINIDLDRFKTINDLLGYSASNQLLIDVAERLKQSISEEGTLSRQGGDEFLALIPELLDADHAGAILTTILEDFNQPFYVDGKEINLTCSLGVAMYPDDGQDFETLLSRSDIAMYQAKHSGRNTYRFFSDDMNTAASEHITIAFGLRKALELNQFQLYYQPQIDITTRKLIGAEALIRWIHPEHGMIPPNKFIPIAEETGLIIPIGEWVLVEACNEVAKWRDAGMESPVVAVNLSALQFARGDVEKSVVMALEQSGIEPGMLELELTESIMIRDPENVLATVQRLKSLGCRLSIDDFGTGYSSLAYLKRFAVDKLKIDQTFVKDLTTNQDDAVIVRTIIQMARNLGLKTIAEGIETPEVLDLLQLYHSDEAQGYFIARPMPASDFFQFMLKSFKSDCA